MQSNNNLTTSSSSSRPPPTHRRHRSSSDPFLDPIHPAPYSPADNKYVPRSAPLPHNPSPARHPSPRHTYDHKDPRMLESAVRDTVTVRAVDPSPRSKLSRNQTGVPQPSSTSRPPPPPTRRAHSQDSVTQAANIVEKARKKPSKKGSTHADVIDRLDFTGVGPMFHHDGPFDACAPSRNRHKTKAPMLAWSSRPDEEPEAPMSAAHLRAERRQLPMDGLGGSRDSPYPAFGTYSRPTESDSYVPPKKQVDRIAEAWGIHEPEPYEEFFAGGGAQPRGETGLASAASSIHGGRESHNNTTRSRHREHLDDGRQGAQVKRTPTRLPPPAPIFLPSAEVDHDTVSASLPSPGMTSPGAPKRTKSLMHKIRKMRDAPNVPADSAELDSPSPSSSLENYAERGAASPETRPGRPSHRSNNSFFGRFGRNTSAARAPVSPTSPTNESEPYVYIEDPKYKANKALPPRPPPGPASPTEKEAGFGSPPTGGVPASPNPGLGRKTSLMKKVKGVVGGGRTGGK